MNIMSLPDDFARCYLEVLKGIEQGPDDSAQFLSWVALDPETFNFLRLTGMAHSAIDIIAFLNGGLPMDMVLAAFPAGSEWFTLMRTQETPSDVNPGIIHKEYSDIRVRFSFGAKRR